MGSSKNVEFIIPDWPAPENIKAAFSTRIGGASQREYAGLNLGLHVDDNHDVVLANRQSIIEQLKLPAVPLYLNQVHGIDTVSADNHTDDQFTITADASWSDQSNRVLAIMTADCLPVLLTSECGTAIAAMHAGWRGLVGGVIENTVKCLPVEADALIAWLGPAIGPKCFEVGSEVKAQFVSKQPGFADYFSPADAVEDKYLADLYGLAAATLTGLGVNSIHGGEHCTYTDQKRFFSHRRDAGKTGRMAAFIWKT